jgi:hypothetical protein
MFSRPATRDALRLTETQQPGQKMKNKLEAGQPDSSNDQEPSAGQLQASLLPFAKPSGSTASISCLSRAQPSEES